MPDMSEDKFEAWLRNQPGVYPTVWEIEFARKAWHARGELEKSNVTPIVTPNVTDHICLADELSEGFD